MHVAASASLCLVNIVLIKILPSGDSRETSMHICLSMTGPAFVPCGMLFFSMQGWVVAIPPAR